MQRLSGTSPRSWESWPTQRSTWGWASLFSSSGRAPTGCTFLQMVRAVSSAPFAATRTAALYVASAWSWRLASETVITLVAAAGNGVGCPASFAMSGPAVLAPTANGGAYTWSTQTPGTYNIACQVGDHCVDGMIVKVVVSSSLAPGPALPPSLSGAPSATMG